MNRPRIGLLTASAPEDRGAFSGTTWFIQRALEKHVGEVIPLGPAHAPLVELAGRVRNAVGTRFHRRFDWRHSLALAAAYRDHFQRIVNDVDLLIAPAAATELALLPPTSAPVVYVTDATFALLHGYYTAFSDLGARSVREANAIEHDALHRATTIVYPSQWAADSAVRDYGVSRDKIHVVPFGANLTTVPTGEEAVRDRSVDAINLVLVGVDWVRKGCDVAVAATAALRDRGADARLTIVGCKRAPRTPMFVDVVSYLDKWMPEQARAYREIFLRSHAMILPTRADCSPIAVADANAHGVPAIVTDTGGMRGMVIDGVNGALMPADAGPIEWADAVSRFVDDRARHRELCRSSRATFDARLNWDCWADAVRSIVAGLRAT